MRTVEGEVGMASQRAVSQYATGQIIPKGMGGILQGVESWVVLRHNMNFPFTIQIKICWVWNG